MKKVMTKFKQLSLVALGIAMIAITTPRVNASVSSDEDDTGGGGGLLDKEHPKNVHCPASTYSSTTFYGESGGVVGTTLIVDGVVKSEYSGSYSRSITQSGSVGAHTGVAIDCYGWGLGCTPKTATEACL